MDDGGNQYHLSVVGSRLLLFGSHQVEKLFNHNWLMTTDY